MRLATNICRFLMRKYLGKQPHEGPREDNNIYFWFTKSSFLNAEVLQHDFE
jgi:hypothetical protein